MTPMPSTAEPLSKLMLVVILLNLVLGPSLMVLALGGVVNWLDGTQIVTVSSVGAAPNCETASAVGDHACNQRVTLFTTNQVVLLLAGLFLIFGGIVLSACMIAMR